MPGVPPPLTANAKLATMWSYTESNKTDRLHAFFDEALQILPSSCSVLAKKDKRIKSENERKTTTTKKPVVTSFTSMLHFISSREGKKTRALQPGTLTFPR